MLLASGVGPTDSDPLTMFSSRTELASLIALLYILYHIFRHYNLSYCDNKGAIKNVNEQMNLGITPFLATYYDLVEVLEVIPLAVAGQ